MSEDWEEQARLGIHMDAESNEIVIEVPSATVRFNGQEATVSVSPIYKNGLCGLVSIPLLFNDFKQSLSDAPY